MLLSLQGDSIIATSWLFLRPDIEFKAELTDTYPIMVCVLLESPSNTSSVEYKHNQPAAALSARPK